jgi:NitT/TauT family transport system ATP-binding protein
VRAELNSHQYSQHSIGSSDFQQSVARIHRLLFETNPETTEAGR